MSELAERVTSIRSAAAKFYAVDLHLHSPRSHDWDNSGPGRDPALDRIPVTGEVAAASVAAYRDLCSRSGRAIVAVTDHNVCSFGLAAAARNGDDGLVVLPGMELSVAFTETPLIRDLRIHVIAIFPETTHRDAFARVLPPGTRSEEERDPHDVFTFKSVDDLVAAIRRENGLAIAAHVESASGIRGVYKNTAELMFEPLTGSPEKQKVLTRLADQIKDELVKFDCIQVRPSTDSVHYRGPDGTLRVPLVVCSDCHGVQRLLGEGIADVCYVKMGQPTFAGLAEAIKFADSRVRFPASLPETRPPRLLGLRLMSRKATENSFFDDTVLAFSDNLTCIIGPRGSGKSAAIDALRYLMGYNRSLSEIGQVAPQILDRQKHTLEKTRIEVLYEASDGKVYCISGTYDPKEPYVAEVADSTGAAVNIDDIESSGIFPLNLYGWGELELLAENPETQRELLDRFIPDVRQIKADKATHLEALASNNGALNRVAVQMDKYFTDPDLNFQRVKEYKLDFESLNTPEIEAVFKELDAVQHRRKVLRKIRKVLDHRADEGVGMEPLGLGALLIDKVVTDWASAFARRLKPDEIDDAIRQASADCGKHVTVATQVVEAEDAAQAKLEEDAKTAIKDAVGDEVTVSGDLRNNAKQRYETARAHQDDYAALYEKFDELREKRSVILAEIGKCDRLIYATRSEKTGWIREQVSLVEDENYAIGLVLEQQGDRGPFLQALTSGAVPFPGQWHASRRAEAVAANLSPTSFAQALLAGDPEPLVDIDVTIAGRVYDIDRSYAERLVAENCPMTDLDGIGAKRVDPVRLRRLLELELVTTDDSFFITLGDRPIQRCSPGQRCSAMLPIVTLTSQAPLVIDQPEDNLDNRLVSRALFKILARLKETRQIVLATHNPNILVSGDAEQVLLLDGDGSLSAFGSVDTPRIVQAVIGLMEGGAEAFARRRAKYEPYL